MAVFSFLWDSTYSVGTHGADGTKVIAAMFIFLAYLLHPAMKSVYRRVRAYCAWRAIEKHQTVEVTRYSIAAGVCGGRGKWDATRTITVLLGVFLLASWGLELSMSLAYYRGDADALNRPPPVTLVYDQDSDAVGYWQVGYGCCCGFVRNLHTGSSASVVVFGNVKPSLLAIASRRQRGCVYDARFSWLLSAC